MTTSATTQKTSSEHIIFQLFSIFYINMKQNVCSFLFNYSRIKYSPTRVDKDVKITILIKSSNFSQNTDTRLYGIIIYGLNPV